MKMDHSESIYNLIQHWKALVNEEGLKMKPSLRSLRVHYDSYIPDKGVVLDNGSDDFLFYIDWSLNPELLELVKGREKGVVISFEGGFETLLKAMNPEPIAFSIRFNGENK